MSVNILYYQYYHTINFSSSVYARVIFLEEIFDRILFTDQSSFFCLQYTLKDRLRQGVSLYDGMKCSNQFFEVNHSSAALDFSAKIHGTSIAVCFDTRLA